MRVQAFIEDDFLGIDISEVEVIEDLIKGRKAAGWYLKSGHMYQLQKCVSIPMQICSWVPG